MPNLFQTVTSQSLNVLSLATGAPIRASLVPESFGMPLMFHFNPMKVKISKSAKTEGSRGVITNQFEDAVKAIGNLTITLSECNFTGYTTKSCCDQLINWTTPVAVPGTGRASMPSMGSASSSLRTLTSSSTQSTSTTRPPSAPLGFAGTGTIYKLPILLFNWGGGGGPIGLSYKVVIEQVDINYERFNAYGVPVWAKVSMTMKEWEDIPPKQNPTSGGHSGRTKHMVTAGESIVRIANQSYGTPTAWRTVADVNGIDDPLRVKPGKLLDLPSLEELEEGSES